MQDMSCAIEIPAQEHSHLARQMQYLALGLLNPPKNTSHQTQQSNTKF